MPDRFCPGGGWLVKEPTPVPRDPADHDDGVSDAVVGCNRLRCGRCAEWVRSHLAYLDGALEPEAIAALYAAEDWTTLAAVTPNPEFRLYACRCSVYLCTSSTRTLDPDLDSLSQVEPPVWVCQGHPEPTLPLWLDGHDVSDVDDLRPLAERLLAGWVPRAAPPPTNFFPAGWASRVYHRLQPLPEADLWAAMVAEGLGRGEHARGLALRFFAMNPRAPGFEQVVEQAESRDPAELMAPIRTWFGRSEDTSDQDWQDLLDLMGGAYHHTTSVLRTLLRRVEWAELPLDDLDARCRELVRAAVIAAPDALDEHAIEALARDDGDWFARQAKAVLRGREDGVGELIGALRDARREEPLIVAGVAISTIGAKRRRELEAWLETTPSDDGAYRAVLRRALRT